MTKLSVNVNKVATLRNARGGNVPNLVEFVKDCQKFGAQAITIHPRPDQRHITYKDVFEIRKVVTTELNIEGNPTEEFIKLVLDSKPEQVTLVPDAVTNITSNAGWDTIKNLDFLSRVTEKFKKAGIRVSIFVDPNAEIVYATKKTGCDRIELYTESYASNFLNNPEKAIENYKISAEKANEIGLGINAGHDLSLENIEYFARNIENLLEVSIGHALISEALYLGIEKTIKEYLNKLSK